MQLPPDINDWPEFWRELYEERAGIIEFIANKPRVYAEIMAEKDIRRQAGEERTALLQ